MTQNNNIELIKGDITKIKADAIVNAANNSLLGGGGVDGAIHRAAGPKLLEATRKLHGCKTGDAKITPGFNLPAKYIIHAVGPVWQGGNAHEKELLASAYRKSMELALSHGVKSIAFPNISTGIYGFPKELAAQIAIKEVEKFLSEHPQLAKVYFVVFDNENYKIYKKLLNY